MGVLYFVFDSWLLAIVAEVTSFALFGIGVLAVNLGPAITIPPMEKQAAANQGSMATPGIPVTTAP